MKSASHYTRVTFSSASPHQKLLVIIRSGWDVFSDVFNKVTLKKKKEIKMVMTFDEDTFHEIFELKAFTTMFS